MSNDHVHPIFQPILAGIVRSARISDHTFRIGHPSYQGANAPLGNLRAAEALLGLMRRGVEREAAQRALADAAKGSHVTVCNNRGDVIEVLAERTACAPLDDGRPCGDEGELCAACSERAAAEWSWLRDVPKYAVMPVDDEYREQLRDAGRLP